MLYTTGGRKIIRIPHQETWELIRLRLWEEERCAINRAITKVLDSCDWTVAGWVPGGIWNGTVYQPIFDKAAKGDYDLAAKMYGLIFWVVVMEHDAKWAFVQDRTGSKRYFRIDGEAGEEEIEDDKEDRYLRRLRGEVVEEDEEESSKEEISPMSVYYNDKTGVSLRDYFAIRLAASLIRNLGNHTEGKVIAKEAYSMADIMLKVREE